jgi:uncharacterized paraquat-inducible protein A
MKTDPLLEEGRESKIVEQPKENCCKEILLSGYPIGWITWFVSLWFYWQGINLPLWQLNQPDHNGFLSTQHLNVSSTIKFAMQFGLYAGAAVVFATTYVIPVAKLIASAWIMLYDQFTRGRADWSWSVSRKFLEMSSSYQFNDIYLVCTMASFVFSGAGSAIIDVQVHDGFFWFLAYILVSLVCAEVIEETLRMRDEVKEATEIDNVAVVVFGVLFLLNISAALCLKVADFQFHFYGLGMTSNQLTLWGIVTDCYPILRFLPYDGLYHLFKISTIFVPILYAILLIYVAVSSLCGSNSSLQSGALKLACRLRQWGTMDVLGISVTAAVIVGKSKTNPNVPGELMIRCPWNELFPGLVHATNPIREVLCPMNLFMLAALCYFMLRWCWQKASPKFVVAKFIFVVIPWIALVTAIHNVNKQEFPDVPTLLNHTRNMANNYVHTLPYCYGSDPSELCLALCVPSVGFGCDKESTITVPQGPLKGEQVKVEIDWARGMDGSQFRDTSLSEAVCEKWDGSKCVDVAMTANVILDVPVIQTFLRADIPNFHDPQMPELSGEVTMPPQMVSLEPQFGQYWQITARFTAHCGPAGAVGTIYGNFSAHDLTITNLAPPQLQVTYITEKCVNIPILGRQCKTLRPNVPPQMIKPLWHQMISEVGPQAEGPISEYMNKPDKLPQLDRSFPEMINMMAAANSVTGSPICPTPKEKSA